MARKRFTVDPNGDKGWKVQSDGKTIKTAKTQVAAIDFAVKTARREHRGGGLAQVLIKNRKGRIRDERTYGADPRGSKG